MERVLQEAVLILNHIFDCIPVLYGSYALEKTMHRSFSAHDVDLLVKSTLLQRKRELIDAFEGQGFRLIPAEVLTFQMDGIDVELADLDRWTKRCGFDPSGMNLLALEDAKCSVLDENNLMKLYQNLAEDPLRPLRKRRTDREKIVALESWNR